MKKLIEGIIIRPSGGSSATRLPIPGVPGTTVRPSEFQAKVEIEIDDILLPLEAQGFGDTVEEEDAEETIRTTFFGDDFGEVNTNLHKLRRKEAVFTFHIGDYIEVVKGEPPYGINLVWVEEFSKSTERVEWSPENPFVTMDEQGVVTYKPRGDFLGNTLVLGVEVSDAEVRPTKSAAQRGEVYKDPSGSDSIPIDTDSPLSETETQEAVVDLVPFENFLGDIDADKFFQAQYANGICALATVYATARAGGHIAEDVTFTEFIQYFAGGVREVVNPLTGETEYVNYEGRAPRFEFAEGQGLYNIVYNADSSVISIDFNDRVETRTHSDFKAITVSLIH